jgi:hypothetical protein
VHDPPAFLGHVMAVGSLGVHLLFGRLRDPFRRVIDGVELSLFSTCGDLYDTRLI